MQDKTTRRVQLDSLETRQLMAATKIMPLGDSITEGWPDAQSYRYNLYNMLAQAGYSVDFVGGQTGNYNKNSILNNLDQNNEGHSGFRADQIRDSIVAWATANKPDVVLLHAGSNDLLQGQDTTSTAAEIGSIIDNLRSVVPNVKILLAKVIPSANSSAMADLNTKIATLGASKSTAGSPITVVDQYTGFNTSTDETDGIHPNLSGELKMAQKWYAALQSILPTPTTPPPGTYLDGLTPTSATNGSGAFEQDRSNGGTGAIDGKTLTLNGATYMRGLGVSASSALVYDITGKGYTQFNSDIGVDDEITSGGGIKFQVYADNVLKYDSGTMTATTATKSISVDITGASALKLVVTDAGGGSATVDHGDWANARVYAAAVAVPSAPTGLGASVSGSNINLSWTDNSSNETNFRIERKAAGGSYATLINVPANQTSYVDLNAAAGTAYTYRVLAYNTGGSSGYSNESTATVPVVTGSAYFSDLPYVVSNNGWGNPEKDRSNGENGSNDGKTITLNGTTYTKGLGVHATSDITLSLAGKYSSFSSALGVDDEVGSSGSVIFQIYVDGTKQYDSGTMTGTTATKTATVSLSGAQTLRLVVTDAGDGNGFDHADWANAYLTSATATVPTAPSNATATYVAGTGVFIGWTDNSNNETGFKIQRQTGSSAWADIATVIANTTAYNDTTGVAGTTYSYRVYATGSAGNSGTSNEPSVTLANVPDAPSGVTASYVASNKTILVTWTDNAFNETAFQVQRKVGSGTWVNWATVGANNTSYIDTVIDPGTTYSYRLYAYNAVGNSATGNEPSVTTPAAPIAPGSASVSFDNATTSVKLVWGDLSSDETGFQIQRKVDTGAWANLTTVAANTTSYTDTTVVRGTYYAYRVYAFNDAGNSATSNEPSLTVPTATTLPNAASGMTATYQSASGQIALSWTDNSDNEQGFRLEKKVGVNGTWTPFVTMGASITTWTDATAYAPSTTVSYRAVAFNYLGDAPASNEASVTTPAAASTVYVSDLPYSVGQNGWGNVEKDKSNGESGSNDGAAITLNGTKYTKGLGTHASSDIYVTLNGQYSTFTSDIGVDDEVGNNGTVVFQVWADGTKIYDSGTMTGASVTKSMSVSVAGKQQLLLKVTDGGDGNGFDHADWANAKLSSVPAEPIPAAASSAVATYNAIDSSVAVTWTDGSTNETGFRIERKIDSGNYASVGTAAANATSFVDTSFNETGHVYTYRVIAFNATGDAVASNESTLSITATTVPAAPSGLTASYDPASKKVTLQWIDASRNETGFRIERQTGTGTWDIVTTVAQNAQTFVDAGPFAVTTTYAYRVVAVNALGDSIASNVQSVTTPSASVFVSDLTPASSSNGWGPIEKDKSNGESGSGDGTTLSIRGKTYAKGIGTHGYSKIVYNLGGAYTLFTSDLGIDDETGGNGSVIFDVYVDGVLKYASGVVTGKDVVKTASINVAGAQQIWLVVENGTDGADFDHADWANATLTA